MTDNRIRQHDFTKNSAAQDGVFSPEHVVVMSEALSYALEQISNSPADGAYSGYSARDVRRMVASAIIREARTQPLVAKRLAEAALQAAAR